MNCSKLFICIVFRYDSSTDDPINSEAVLVPARKGSRKATLTGKNTIIIKTIFLNFFSINRPLSRSKSAKIYRLDVGRPRWRIP